MVVGFIVVTMAMYTAVLERTREIGILKALGASSAYILNLLFRETLLIAILGSFLGIVMTEQMANDACCSGQLDPRDRIQLVAYCVRRGGRRGFVGSHPPRMESN
ncbi:MAG TPA: ABC transporter permease [Candidatus Sulfotelmatobacter sp.]|nr:ABC transporter permease [Candidatus Sulfotelmatobacter sp.]